MTRFERPALITVLAVLQGLGAAFWLLLTALFTLGGTWAGEDTTLTWSAVAVVGVLAVLQLACGVGLWGMRAYGRILQLIFAGVGLLAFPFGTVIAILILLYLTRPGMRVMFSGRPAGEWTAEDRALVTAVPQLSTPVVVVSGVAAMGAMIVSISIVAAVAVPGMLSARMSGYHAATVSILTEIATAQAAYAASCGNGGFAGSTIALTTGPGGVPITSSGLRDLTESGRAGYFFTLGPVAGAAAGPADCNGTQTVTAWFATAVPQTFRSTGLYSFAVNSAGEIWRSEGTTPPAEPFGPPAERVR